MELSLSFPAQVFTQLLQPPWGRQQELQEGKAPHYAAPLYVPPFRTPTKTHAHRHAPTCMLYLCCFIALTRSSSFRARCRSPFTCSFPLM